MSLRNFAAVAAVLAAALPAAAQQPVVSTAAEVPTGARQRLFEMIDPPAEARFWVNADYVLWFVQTVGVPELIQSVPAAQAVNLGASLPAGTADRLFPGQRELYFGGASGLRGQVGYRLSENWAVDASGFVLESRAVGGEGGGDGSINSPGVARSYIQAGTGVPITLYSNLPGSYAGSIKAFADTQLWGLEGNLRRDTYRLFCDRAELIGGLKYLDLTEHIVIRDFARFGNGTTLAVQDVFRTRNRFFGSHSGFQAQWDTETWHLDLTAKMGLGFVNQRVESAGSNTYVSAAGAVDAESGGLYARPFNQGTYERDKAAFMSELGLNVGHNITPNIRGHVGYNIIYLSSVVRAGEMIDPVLNDSRVRYVGNPFQNNLNLPAFDWGRASDFWVQGINFGLSVKY